MKIKTLLTAFSLAFTTLFTTISLTSCNNATDPATSTAASGSMIATVNGTTWNSTTIPGISGGTVGARSVSTNTLVITGTKINLDGTHETIGLTLIHPHLGIDSLGLTNAGVYTTGNDQASSYVTVGFNAGNVNVTKLDTVKKEISGTFNFTAQQATATGNTVHITNGSFTDVSWTDQ